MSFDRTATEDAIRALLSAVGVDPDDPALADTPRLTASAWEEDLLDGYTADPAAILGETFPAESGDMVVMNGVRFHSMCPHHLLPYTGMIHLGYLPKDKVVGLSRLVKLVDAFAHRLVLQEHLTSLIADALTEHLGATGAAVTVVARQGCMAFRGVKRSTDVVTTAWRGSFTGNATLQDQFQRATAQEATGE